jgi:hypothetical protein
MKRLLHLDGTNLSEDAKRYFYEDAAEFLNGDKYVEDVLYTFSEVQELYDDISEIPSHSDDAKEIANLIEEMKEQKIYGLIVFEN